jgi:hypothetical protein
VDPAERRLFGLRAVNAQRPPDLEAYHATIIVSAELAQHQPSLFRSRPKLAKMPQRVLGTRIEEQTTIW